MKHTKRPTAFLLGDRINNASHEAELIRSTWATLSQGKMYNQDELRDTFAFDFSDIIPSMKWDKTNTPQ